MCRCEDSDEEGGVSQTPKAGRSQRLDGGPTPSEDGQPSLIGLVELGNLKPRAEHSLAAKVRQELHPRSLSQEYPSPAWLPPEPACLRAVN